MHFISFFQSTFLSFHSLERTDIGFFPSFLVFLAEKVLSEKKEVGVRGMEKDSQENDAAVTARIFGGLARKYLNVISRRNAFGI